MNPDQRCMAHIFNDAGYNTGFIGKWHLSAGCRKLAGKHMKTKADVARSKLGHREILKLNAEPEFTPPGPQRLGYKHWEVNNFSWSFHNYFYYHDEPKRIYSGKFETDAIADQTIAFMKQSQEPDHNQPFMLMVAPHPPHPPFDPKAGPAGYRDKIPTQLHWSPNVPEKHQKGRTNSDARSYYAMVQNVDDNIGRIMAFLDESGLAENTIVVFTSDHGEMFGSHNRRNKMVPYAEAVNIPLIVRWPGQIKAGTRTDMLQSPIDHMPTLCSLAGLDTPDTADGTDLSPVLLNKGNVEQDAILMANYVSNWDYFDSGTNWPEWRGVRTERFTYAKWLAGKEAGKEELYDNLDDPHQMRNLAEGNQDLPTLQKLRSRMKDLLADAHDEMLLGHDYADWYDEFRNPVKTALGPI